MITTLIAALSMAVSAAIDVPYLPQTDAMCGGAATAMVFRYWGDTHADVQEFAPLVDRRAGGIADGVLEEAVRDRGWRVGRVDGSLDALRERIDQRQPVIVLIADRGDRYHYVVVVASTADAVVVHDPAWGPSRSIRAQDFERLWKASKFWSMVILPPVTTPAATGVRSASLQACRPPGSPEGLRYENCCGAGLQACDPPTACDQRLSLALSDIRERGLDQADALLGEVRAECPNSSGPISELSGVRFAQHRWRDAAALAREALAIDSHDEYALDLLGSSLFMQDDYGGALRAWNQLGKPRVNLVRIEGLHHPRYQAITDALEIRGNQLLTADAFERARRRLGELPDQSTARLAVRPEADGFATVDVVVAERAALPTGVAAWSATAAGALVDREVAVAVPGFTGQGDVWSASWRWWSNRPAVSVGFTTPGVHGLPGVWHVEGSWQSDAYSFAPQDGAGVLTRESRAHGAVTMSDWLSGSLRYSVTAGFDSWNDVSKAIATGGSLEQRLFGDRVSLTGDATRWTPVAGGAPFLAAGAGALLRSSTDTRGWVVRGTAGAQRVSDRAPLGLWPGAGDGHAREPLLRAHPLLTDGIVDLSDSVFGRTLTDGGVEVQRWLERPALVHVAIAGFADAAGASRQIASVNVPAQLDLGVGLRLKIPGSAGVLRVDIARGVRDGANALTFGIMR